MGSYQDNYNNALTLLLEDIETARAEIDNEEDEETRLYLQGVLRGLDKALEILKVWEPSK